MVLLTNSLMIQKMSNLGLKSSQAYRWVPCPASVEIQKRHGVTSDKNVLAIEEGNAFDELSNQLIQMFTNPSLDAPRPGSLIGELTDSGVVITEEMYDSAVMYATTIFKYCNLKKLFNKVNIQEPLPVPFIDEGKFGIPDVNVYWEEGNELVIWDGKYGHKLVEPYNNYTLMIYAIAKIQQLGLSQDAVVRLVIIQPRCFQSTGPVREWVTNVETIESMSLKILKSAEQAKSPDAPAIPGNHCINCSGGHACEALKNTNYNYLDYNSTAKSGGTMSPENLAFELKLVERGFDMAKARFESLKAQATAIAKRGESVPGWGLEPTQGNLKWNKPIEEIIALGQLYSKDVTKEIQLVTPSQAIHNLKIDEAVISQYSSRPNQGQKLVFDDGVKARNVFKKESN